MIVCEHQWKPIETTCCGHERCSRCQVIRKRDVCKFHRPLVCDYGREYWYREAMGNFREGIPLNATAIGEIEAFEEMGKVNIPQSDAAVVEYGAGIGRMLPHILSRTSDYLAIDGSEWASQYVHNAYNVRAECEQIAPDSIRRTDLAICVHTLEHLRSADAVLAAMCEQSMEVFLIVPDQGDLYNPDHWWFFTAETLRTWFNACGYKVIAEQEQDGQRERFLWCLAGKNTFSPRKE